MVTGVTSKTVVVRLSGFACARFCVCFSLWVCVCVLVPVAVCVCGGGGVREG